MYVTGMEVKRGRREFGDRDTYDFKLQCSGVWQSYMGMKFAGHQEEKHQECPNGEGTSGLKVFRGFIEWGDKDMYEYDLNCKSIAQNLASIRGLPDLKMLGLPRNVLVWDGEQLTTWLDALGLSHVAPAFLDHNINGGTVFLLTEDHLRDLGLTIVGDRLYFIDLLTQLYDDIVAWSSAIGVQLATHPVPPLRKIGLSLQPTSWTVKDVCKVLKAVGLEEYMELFVEHRVQGDVRRMRHTLDQSFPRPADQISLPMAPALGRSACYGRNACRAPPPPPAAHSRLPAVLAPGQVLFNLTEENLKEMGVDKIGDRLLITDITQTLYEQVTGWSQEQVSTPQLLQIGAQ